MRTFRFIPFLSLLILAACSQGGPQDNANGPNPNVAVPQANLTAEGNVSIAKESLGKDFLLQASLVDQNASPIFGSPTSQALQNRVVRFVQQKDKLFLMESSQGYVASDEFPADRILTEFKIIKEEENKIVFDFNEGMRNIFVYGELAFPVGQSFLKEVTQKENRLMLKQIAQVRLSTLAFPVEVTYYLEPYLPNANFEPFESRREDYERVRFFETTPSVVEEFGGAQQFINKWDIQNPIFFYISDNTPEEYRDAVREGVLYWNKAFGTETVKVEMAPKGITAPNPDYNIIQWVTNHEGGLAYADMQEDPQTGELLHAQIYFASSWAVRSLDALLQESVAVSDTSENLEMPALRELGLKGFRTGSVCEYPKFDSFEDLLSMEETVPGQVKKLTKDIVRVVIAHEVGHVLGLRHNFAGSAFSELKPSEIDTLFEKYLQTGGLEKNAPVSSSVMDYLRYKEDVLIGAYIAQPDSKALSYDAMAIRWAYLGATIPEKLEGTLFCTDDMAYGKFEDCRRRDGSGVPLAARAQNFEENIKDLPGKIAQMYLEAKSDFNPRYRLPVEKVPLDAGWIAKRLTGPLEDWLSYLRSDVRFLEIDRAFPFVSDLNEEEIEEKTVKWFDQVIAEAGGVEKMLPSISRHTLYGELQNYQKRFEKIISNPAYQEGKTIFGEDYKFSDEELGVMRENAAALFDLLKEKFVEEVTEILAARREPVFANTSFSIMPPSEPSKPFILKKIADLKGLEKTLGHWAAFVVLEGAEKKPEFTRETRLRAADILHPYTGPVENWQKENREQTFKDLLAKLEQRYGKPFESIDPNALKEKEREAYQVERRLLESLSLWQWPPKDPQKPIPILQLLPRS